MEYRSPVCKARICRKSPLMFQHPSFILARRNNRHHFRVSSRVMPMPPGYTKVFGFAPTWCTTNSLTVSVRLFFYCNFPGRCGWVHHRETRTARAPRSAYRGAKTPRWGVFRARESPEQSAPQTALRKRRAVFIMIAALCECFHLAVDLW